MPTVVMAMAEMCIFMGSYNVNTVLLVFALARGRLWRYFHHDAFLGDTKK